jgi:hypothetical protein
MGDVAGGQVTIRRTSGSEHRRAGEAGTHDRRDHLGENGALGFGNAGFVTFMCNGVAARLGDSTFTDLLEEWRGVLGNAGFVTFMCDSVAARLGDSTFTDLLEEWRGPRNIIIH